MIDLARISPPNRRSNYLLVVRLDNARHIASAYGTAALITAMAHVRGVVASHLDPVVCRETADEIVVLAHAAMLEADFVRTEIEALCARLSGTPVEHEGSRILLSVSIGHSDPAPGGLESDTGAALKGALNEALNEAGTRLQCVAAPALSLDAVPAPEAARYRADMARAARLLDQVARGEMFFAWRPIHDPRRPDRLLQHEALLRYADAQGEQFDCTAAYQALERVGLAHLLDRALVLRVLDELEADPRARLSIAISPQSLSFDLGGQDAAWTDFLARIERHPDLAERLVIEFHESAATRFWPGTLTFLNTLRALGIGIGLVGFGSGHASVRQLAVLRPSQIKLDSAFLRTAFLSERNRARVGQLAAQARTLCDSVVFVGADTPAQIRLAVEEGAQWVAGQRLGRVCTRRTWNARDRSPAHHAGMSRAEPSPALADGLRPVRSPVF
ncbi:EAL domain-containing protein [Novosphingobium sp. ZW T3_23]|uniref:EAL domain-containing protein n=1 Tax=Novosphingobium sp. ZW T3_23 TaxID=3378084 RepID=UPI003851AB76